MNIGFTKILEDGNYKFSKFLIPYNPENEIFETKRLANLIYRQSFQNFIKELP